MMRRWSTLSVLSLVASACASGGTQGAGGEDAQLAERPEVSIVVPADGVTVQSGDVTIRATTEAFLVVERLGEEPRPGEGHLHFYKDVSGLPVDPGEPAVTEPGTYAAVASETHVWRDVEPGTHSFSVQLVQNDHTPLDPPVTATATVTVE